MTSGMGFGQENAPSGGRHSQPGQGQITRGTNVEFG